MQWHTSPCAVHTICCQHTTYSGRMRSPLDVRPSRGSRQRCGRSCSITRTSESVPVKDVMRLIATSWPLGEYSAMRSCPNLPEPRSSRKEKAETGRTLPGWVWFLSATHAANSRASERLVRDQGTHALRANMANPQALGSQVRITDLSSKAWCRNSASGKVAWSRRCDISARAASTTPSSVTSTCAL